MKQPNVVADYGAAQRAMMNRPFCESPKYDEQQWRANREGAHPRILEFEEALVKRFHNLGVPLYAHCVVRTPEDQDAAFALGNSNIKGSDPYPHRFAAVDIIHGVLGWNLPEKCWDLIGHVGKEIAAKQSLLVTWGGDWKRPYDPAHWEITHWKTIDPNYPHMSLIGGKTGATVKA